MKRFLGFLFCMGIVLAGTATVYGTPPGAEQVQYEVVVDVGGGEFSPVCVEVLTHVSNLAAQKASAGLSVELSAVTDTSLIRQMVADLRANSGRKYIGRLIDTKAEHRWRARTGYNHYVVDEPIYRPGWKRKVCEG